VEAIMNGTQVQTADLPKSGVVMIASNFPDTRPSICTGVLLTDRWVLTAEHCFCSRQLNAPSTVSVSVYGSTAQAADSTGKALYGVTATQIVVHPTLDAALVKLSATLPFTTPPLLYTGNGSDLKGKSGTAYGFGDYYTAFGSPAGAGQVLNTTAMSISSL